MNQVGGQDELVFDGGSFVLNSDCHLALQMPTFQDGLVVSRWRRQDDGWGCDEGTSVAPHEGLGAIYRTMTLGLRNYVNKKGFKENQDYIDKIVTLFNWRQSNEEDWKPKEEHFKADFDDVLAKRRNNEDLPDRYQLK